MFKLVINNNEKAYSKELNDHESQAFLGKKIGDDISGSNFGFKNYEFKITGGSDKDGFPMRKDLGGTSRKKLFIVVDRKKGEKKRITKRGNIVAEDIKELNVMVTKYGSVSLDEILGKNGEAPKDEKMSVKEEMVKKSLEAAGTADTAKAMSGIKFKKGEVINASDVFGKGDIVVVTGISKGKGFAGVVKRWGFAGGPKTHGQSDRLRAPGAIGQGTSPGRVHKGKKMAGRMGGNTVTLKNLFVIDVDKESGEVKLSGSVPGKTGGLLRIEKLGTKKLEELIKEETQRVVEAEVVSDGDSKKSNTGNVENSSEDSEKKV